MRFLAHARQYPLPKVDNFMHLAGPVTDVRTLVLLPVQSKVPNASNSDIREVDKESRHSARANMKGVCTPKMSDIVAEQNRVLSIDVTRNSEIDYSEYKGRGRYGRIE